MPRSDIAGRAQTYVESSFSGNGGAPRPFDPGRGTHVANAPEELARTIQKARTEVGKLKQTAARVSDMSPEEFARGKGILGMSHVMVNGVVSVRFPDAGGHEQCCDHKKFTGDHHKTAIKPSEARIDALDAGYAALKGLAAEAAGVLKGLQKAVSDGAAAKKKGDDKRAERQKKAAMGAVRKLQALEKKHAKAIKDVEKQAAALDKALLATKVRSRSEKLKLA